MPRKSIHFLIFNIKKLSHVHVCLLSALYPQKVHLSPQLNIIEEEEEIAQILLTDIHE